MMNDIFTPTICWCKGCWKAKDADFISYIINCSELSTAIRWNSLSNHFIMKNRKRFWIYEILFSTLNQFSLYLIYNACQKAGGHKSHLNTHLWKQTSEILVNFFLLLVALVFCFLRKAGVGYAFCLSLKLRQFLSKVTSFLIISNFEKKMACKLSTQQSLFSQFFN